MEETKPKILLCEDDTNLGMVLKNYLELNDYDVTLERDGRLGLAAFQREKFDICLLDVMMPNMDGNQVLKEVRKELQLPILMLSAKTTDIDKIKGLVTGADDYVAKPFNPLEVMARIKSLLRRSNYTTNMEEPNKLEVGPLLIEKESHEVRTINGEFIQLTALEFGILYLLASHPNRVFSADEIFERVWQQESLVSAKTVMVHVSHLRDKIEEATGGEKVIQTVWGVGYKIGER